MPGGIEWFRWHHGSVTDPKFGLIARKTGASTAEVVAVWAYLLEAASAAEDRGDPGTIDIEALSFCLGFDDGKGLKIYEAMRERGLFDPATGRVSAWEKRQTKRERDDLSTGRVQAFRARQRLARAGGTVETPGNASGTPRSANETLETPREEKRREEQMKDMEPSAPVSSSDARGALPSCPYDRITALYHQQLPSLPRVKLMTDKRRKALSRAWRWVLTSKKSSGERRATCVDEALEWFDGFFGLASDNDFLMGRTRRGEGHENWRCDLDYLLTDRGMTMVIEKTRDST